MGRSLTPELKKLLRQYGCELYRQGKVSHAIWRNPKNNQLTTVSENIKSRHTANKALKDLGFDKQF